MIGVYHMIHFEAELASSARLTRYPKIKVLADTSVRFRRQCCCHWFKEEITEKRIYLKRDPFPARTNPKEILGRKWEDKSEIVDQPQNKTTWFFKRRIDDETVELYCSKMSSKGKAWAGLTRVQNHEKLGTNVHGRRVHSLMSSLEKLDRPVTSYDWAILWNMINETQSWFVPLDNRHGRCVW